MDSPGREYDKFLKKVQRTMYVDNISPLVNESILKAAFNQFGSVKCVKLMPTYMQPKGAPLAALVEMENSKQAEQIIREVESCPFMIAGVPRPVRAKTARVEMFDDRPRKPNRVIKFLWLPRTEPAFKTANKIKKLVKKNAEEASYLLQRQVVEEAKLGKQHAEMLNVNHKKLELIDSVIKDGSAKRLSEHYSIDTKDP